MGRRASARPGRPRNLHGDPSSNRQKRWSGHRWHQLPSVPQFRWRTQSAPSPHSNAKGLFRSLHATPSWISSSVRSRQQGAYGTPCPAGGVARRRHRRVFGSKNGRLRGPTLKVQCCHFTARDCADGRLPMFGQRLVANSEIHWASWYTWQDGGRLHARDVQSSTRCFLCQRCRCRRRWAAGRRARLGVGRRDSLGESVHHLPQEVVANFFRCLRRHSNVSCLWPTTSSPSGGLVASRRLMGGSSRVADLLASVSSPHTPVPGLNCASLVRWLFGLIVDENILFGNDSHEILESGR